MQTKTQMQEHIRCDTDSIAIVLFSTLVKVVHLGSSVNGFHASVCSEAELLESE